MRLHGEMLQYSTSYEELNITFSEEMFTSGAIQMKRDVVANVLIIGMGAGALNSYLYTTYPKVSGGIKKPHCHPGIMTFRIS